MNMALVSVKTRTLPFPPASIHGLTDRSDLQEVTR